MDVRGGGSWPARKYSMWSCISLFCRQKGVKDIKACVLWASFSSAKVQKHWCNYRAVVWRFLINPNSSWPQLPGKPPSPPDPWWLDLSLASPSGSSAAVLLTKQTNTKQTMWDAQEKHGSVFQQEQMQHHLFMTSEFCFTTRFRLAPLPQINYALCVRLVKI